MDTPSPIYLDPIEQAQIQADALAGAFEDHRAAMNPTSFADLIRERQLHTAATMSARLVDLLVAEKARQSQAAAS